MELARVLDVRFLTKSTFILQVEKPEVPVRAGQCYSVGTAELAINREYSIYSGANEKVLEFLIKEVEGGIVTSELKKLAPSDEITLTGPFGEFCIDRLADSGEEFLFIASGTGIAPFHSFINTYPQIKYTILHGIRYAEEEYDKANYLHGCYTSCVSRPNNKEESIRVTDKLKDLDLSNKIIFLCGNRKMISDSLAIIRSKGISGDRVFTETFF